MALPNAPQSRNEKYLAKIAGQEVELPNEPLSREEQYLEYIATHGGGGGGGVTYYLENGKIAQESPEEYITTPLDIPMTPGRYLVKIYDEGDEREDYITWTKTETYEFGGMDLTITENTAGLSYYAGSYRDIYCDIISTGQGDYEDLINLPSINNVELSGNKTTAQLGLMASDGVVANPEGQTTETLTALEVDGTKYAVSGGSSLEAGDYIDIENNVISVIKHIPGNTTSYEIKSKDTTSTSMAITVVKTVDGTVVSSTDYTRSDTEAETDHKIFIDDILWIGFMVAGSQYSSMWSYGILSASDTHDAGYRIDWMYNVSVDYTETFEIDNTPRDLVTKADLHELKTLHLSSDATNGNGVRGTGLNIEDVVIVGVSSGDSSSDLMWNLGMKNVSGGKHEYTIRFFRPSGDLCANMNFWADVFYYDR